MKNYLLIGLLCCLGESAWAQVTMTAQVPPEGVLMKAQLWNIVLVSASDQPVSVRVVLRLVDMKNNQPVLTGVSGNIILNKGAKQLKVSDLGAIEYNYLSPAADRSPNGLLTAGNYQVCYSVTMAGQYKGDLFTEDCVPFSVAPVSPPILNVPADKSILEGYAPQFSWLPPSPANIFGDLNYEMLLVEVRKGQSPAEAVQYNMPVYRMPATRNVFVNYPSSAMSLDTGKLYAWTVIAKNGVTFAAQTEVWTFCLKNNLQKKIAPQYSYVQLRKKIDGIAATVGKNIFCSYINDANDAVVRYELIGLEDRNEVIQSGTIALNPGGNMLDFELKRSYHLKRGRSYLFRLKNGRNEYWQVKFIYRKD